MRKFGVLALVALACACGPKIIPAPVVVTPPRFPEFVQPTVPPSFENTPAAVSQDRGWRFLQSGDLKNAQREFDHALTIAPAFYPADASLGYLELAGREPKDAVPHFDRALERQHDYLPALVGRGQAFLALNREADALASFEAAVAADPSLSDLKRRVEVLRFRLVEQNLAGARQAARAGRLDEAARMYANAISSSPESAFLYRELAAIEHQKGENDAALADYRKAVELDPSDAASLVQIGDILLARNELDAAAKAYSDALKVEPSTAVEAKLAGVRGRLELARLPEEYRAIDQSPQATRADLAALIGIRLGSLLQPGRTRNPAVVTDVRNNWAAPWIMAVARAGVMEPYANHTFQPRAVVRRSDLAQAVTHLLTRIAATNPSRARAWQSARLKFADLSPGHLAYPAASAAVASGVLTMGPDDTFQPSRPVTGAEVIQAIGRLEELAGNR